MNGWRVVMIVVALVGGAACEALGGLSGGAGPDVASDAAAGQDADGDGGESPGGDTESGALLQQADTDGGAEGGVACVPGSTRNAKAVSDDSSAFVPPACNVGSAATQDGNVAGLDLDSTSIAGTVDDTPVGACLRFDFDPPVTTLAVYAKVVDNACGTPCTDPYCNNSAVVELFAGTSPVSIHFVDTLTFVGNGVSRREVNVHDPAGLIVVCRSIYPEEEDVGIDTVVATCLTP